jgi:putative addiction module CopG family antidote
MDIHLTPDQRAFIREAIASGRFQRTEDAVQEALSLWEERERRRLEILAAVDRAEISLAEGRGRTVTASDGARELAAGVKQRGLALLNIEKNSAR